MTAYVLVPGAGGSAWYWHRLVDELARRGDRAVAVDLPGADPDAGLGEYRDLIVAAAKEMGERVVLVGQSLGAFSAPLACDDAPVGQLVLVNPMIPRPGETAGDWWEAVGWREAAGLSAEREGRPAPDVRDVETLFFHDLPRDVVEIMRADPEAAEESPAVFTQPWPRSAWPGVPTSVLSGREDRLFPIDLQRRVARDRLGLEIRALPGGHLLALSQPGALADYLTGPPGNPA